MSEKTLSRIKSGIPAVVVLFLVINSFSGFFVDPDGEARAYQEILKRSGLKKNELSVSEVSLDHGLFGSTAQYKFNIKKNEESSVQIDLQRPLNLLSWNTVGYQID